LGERTAVPSARDFSNLASQLIDFLAIEPTLFGSSSFGRRVLRAHPFVAGYRQSLLHVLEIPTVLDRTVSGDRLTYDRWQHLNPYSKAGLYVPPASPCFEVKL
jgi:hypothetical protein